ncbi:MAG: hypothetical protein Q4C88_05960 [Akkermansia sp.]|nr:hypothetical protein [Akkermansia sp.]
MALPLTEKKDLAGDAVLDVLDVENLDKPVTGRELLGIFREYTTRMHAFEKQDYCNLSQLARHLGISYYAASLFVREHTVASKRSSGGRVMYSVYDAKKQWRAAHPQHI